MTHVLPVSHPYLVHSSRATAAVVKRLCIGLLYGAFSLLIPPLASPVLAGPTADALDLQQGAMNRLEVLRGRYLGTLDAKPMQAALLRIEAELGQSGQVLRAAGDDAGLAAGMVKQAYVWRLLDQPAKAGDLYAEAAAAAARARHQGLEADAWSGKARCEISQNRLDRAQQDAERAVPLARAARNAFALSTALGSLTEVHIDRKDLKAAEATSTQEMAAAAEAVDKSAQLLAHLHRGRLHQAQFGDCDVGGDVQPCLDALRAASADFQAARAIALGLKYAAMAENLEVLLTTAETLRLHIQNRGK